MRREKSQGLIVAEVAEVKQKPTATQRRILERLVVGDRLCFPEGERSLCLISEDGDFHGRVGGDMRWRLTRNGWLKARQITALGRAALVAAVAERERSRA